MDNPVSNKCHLPCQSWAVQNGWSTTSTQGSLFNPLPSSQHHSLDSSSGQRSSYGLLQPSSQSCMSDIGTFSSTHHSDLYKPSHSNSLSSTSLFANTAIPSVSHGVSFVQQGPHTSQMLLPASQGKTLPPLSLPQTNQIPQPCTLQQPHVLANSIYKQLFHTPVSNLGFEQEQQQQQQQQQQQHINASQATSEGATIGFAGVSGNIQSHSSDTSQEQCQWIPALHCRGATSECVPDAAPHPNRKSSQEGNTNPPAGSKTRSSLLLQREQLLQQLAMLDKHLESVSPEDSSDGQSPHTDVQSFPSMDDSSQCEAIKTEEQLSPAKSPSCLSADYSSAEPCDQQDETCDTPEDPMSEAESVKKENASDSDADPDYSPNSASGASDIQSDPEGSVSDEAGHSSSLSPSEERPPQDESVPQPAQTPASKQKKPPETVVLPRRKFERQRVNDRKNYCLFCLKPVCKMARHLGRTHSDKKEVAAAFQHPANSKERLKIWLRLINQGNFVHNKKVLQTGKGQLAVRKRPDYAKKARDFLHCPYCRGLYLRFTLSRHMKICPEKVQNGIESPFRRKQLASCALAATDDLDVTDGLKSILAKMMYNDVTQLIVKEPLILQFGELLFKQYGSDEKRHEYVRQNLRQIGRLVLEAQKKTPLKNTEDFFLPSNFPHVVSAVKVLAGYDSKNKRYVAPSLAIKIGYQLQKICGIVEANAVKCGDTSLAESAKNFLTVYQKKWNKHISGGALKTLRETKLVTQKKVPLVEDVKRLSFCLENISNLAEKNLRESTSAENYAALARVTLVQTVVMNRRRVTEISQLKLKDFMSRKTSPLQAGVDISMSELEIKICRFFARIEIRGNCGRMVPILLKPSVVSAMELLVKVREACGVPSENLFLFGQTNSLSTFSGSECIQRYVKNCGAKDPESITVRKIRKHYATMLQMINLDESEAEQILGPNNQVRALRENISLQLDDSELDSNDRLKPSRRQHADRKKNGAKNQSKHKWDEAEVLAVERHLMRFIRKHKVPQKDDCIRCLEEEAEALGTRSWRGVKDYVRNRITSLKNGKDCGAKDRKTMPSTKVGKPDTAAQRMNPGGKMSDQILSPSSQVPTLRHSSSMPMNDERLPLARGQQAASWDHSQHQGTHYESAECYQEQSQGGKAAANMSAPPKSVKSASKGTPKNSKQKWDEAEVRAVERHMMSFIQGRKVPQKNDCTKCLAAEPKALETRTWKGVKDYVRNRITALTRQRR